MKKSFLLTLGMVALSLLPAQTPALIGYWQNWNDGSAPYIQLDQVDARYNVIEVSFAVPGGGTDYAMTFAPDQVSQATLIAQIQALQSQGRKVLISLGGATAPVSLDNTAERDGFISTMGTILNTYNFDGIDIDFEGSSVTVSAGTTIAAPTDAKILHLIFALKKVMQNYRAVHANTKLMLTMAPETAFVQGGQSAYGGIWGAYLPVIHALRDSLDILQVQLYNSGSMYGIDGGIYTQGTADFIVAMTEAVIQGFATVGSGGTFAGLPASKIAIALPACPSAAGGGYTAPATVAAAINYLRGTGPKPGAYTRVQAGGYPDLRGMMTWSVNWDKVTTCNPTSYQYAQSFQNIFAPALPVTLLSLEARQERNGIELKWETSQEANINYYQLEHASDAVPFQELEKIPARNSGTAQQQYQYFHTRPSPHTNYYRLKMMEADGSFKYSNIVVLLFDTTGDSVIFPNPVTDRFYLKNMEESGSYRLFNIQGKMVQQGTFLAGEPIFVPALPPGIYYLWLAGRLSRFVKQ